MKVVDGQRGGYRPSTTPPAAPAALRRGPLLVTAVFAALGGAVIPAAALPALWRVWQLYAMLFGAVAAVGIVAAVAVLGWPTRKTARFGALAAAGALVLWVISRPLGLLTRFDPWQPADTVAGFTDYVAAGLQVIAVLGFLFVARRRAHPWPSAARRATAWVVLFPVLVAVLATGVAGTVAAGDSSTGPTASTLLDAGPGTVEYCRPDGIPLAMDVHRRTAGGPPAPVVLLLHGGGLVLGNRKPAGPGALLAGSRFGPLRDELTARGFAVAVIDFRLVPAAPWPAPLADARCAVRFLKANAAALDVDPARIAVAGTGTGGTLASLLGVARGQDTGQYGGQDSTVRAVAALSAPAAFDLAGLDPLTRASVLMALGRSPSALSAASPLTHAGPGAPPFLLGNGGRKSAEFAARLRAAGVPVTEGAVSERAVADFFAAAVG
ncbi:alpha/beta hydrolase fold domain-containing protein [Amycolatopsis sp. DG1A-15b]|uniref:alpha/beta hydrolase fold domain-containing protein n=1 Tax=Amycolatopsis sp. DG1A-15b TaxID=3052846 RepID=UPI00255BEEDE|nr:alpha/beta hydrolase fold domain-containing protein [Amycolatopsis sp. DG1A-15b]WIX90122.1 alpha/beta hydrolase fold domain-containing protein [Amycolatopsis sp. DG1A-15b]